MVFSDTRNNTLEFLITVFYCEHCRRLENVKEKEESKFSFMPERLTGKYVSGRRMAVVNGGRESALKIRN